MVVLMTALVATEVLAVVVAQTTRLAVQAYQVRVLLVVHQIIHIHKHQVVGVELEQ
jgi:hypothetical protein